MEDTQHPLNPFATHQWVFVEYLPWAGHCDEYYTSIIPFNPISLSELNTAFGPISPLKYQSQKGIK